MGKISGVAYLTSRWIRRQPMWLVQDLFIVAGFAILMFVWGGISGLRNVLVAWFISGSWGMGVNLVAQSIGWDKQGKTMDMFIASPVKPFHYIFGYFISSLIFLVADFLYMLPLIFFLNAWGIVLASLIAVAPLLVISNFVGLAIVMRIKKPTNISAITNPIQMMLIILPPVFYPAHIIPLPARYFVLMLPTAAGAELARQLSGLSTWGNLWYPVAVLLIWLVLGIVTSSRAVKWGME
ncbi:MAG: ABC transporter permease [Thermoplasmata archaeon]|nr:ABC transporter permease [Thermoplasmata archaeon]